MSPLSINMLQWIPPAVVMVLLCAACYFFWSKYVRKSQQLCIELEKIGATVRTMLDGDESMRRSGVDKAFKGTELDTLWREFSKTLHTQTKYLNGSLQPDRTRLTVPASSFFSAAAVIDRRLGVEYFKHLPGILTGIGIIGTFSGLLFGLSSFDASDAESMSKSISLLLSGVRDAFYASAAAITAAMVITHWEKWLYRRCLCALDGLVDSINGLFESGVGEEYLAELVSHSQQSSDQLRHVRNDLVQALMPIIRQMDAVQTRQTEQLSNILESVLTDSNRRLSAQLEAAMGRQVRAPLEDLAKGLESRFKSSKPGDFAMKVIRARQSNEPALDTKVESP